MGVVTGVHGVRGLVKVKSFAAEPKALGAYGPLEDETGQRRYVVNVKGASKGTMIVEVEGIASRDAAEGLKGVRLFVDRAALPAAEEGEFYHADLIDLAAKLRDGTAFGVVRAVHDYGAGISLEIARPEGKIELMPFTKSAVPVVDIDGGFIIVEPPIGLLDDVVRDDAVADEAVSEDAVGDDVVSEDGTV